MITFPKLHRLPSLISRHLHSLSFETTFFSKSFFKSNRCHFSNHSYQIKNRKLPVVYHPLYSAPQLPPRHRFPMQIFRIIYEKLLKENIITTDQVYIPQTLPTPDQLHLVHDASYVSEFCEGAMDAKKMKKIGFPWSPSLVLRTLSEVSGTILTAKLALEVGLACNTAGGTHHAFPSYGSGYCIINDLAITSMILLQENLVKKILILDLDVHQGDGTACIFENKKNVFTMSMHCKSNFPTQKQKSDMDIELANNMDDDTYINILSHNLSHVLNSFKPDIVLYDAGVDVHKDDVLGNLSITQEGLYRREMLVLDVCVGYGIPIACYIGGGYSNDLNELAERHCILHKCASKIFKDYDL